MEKNQIILIHLYYSESGYGDKLNFPPLGIAYISEYLNFRNVAHNIIDMGVGYTPEDILEKIRLLQVKWIGISINSLEILKTRNLIEKVRVLKPDVNIVVGGPHITTQGVNIFSGIPFIDYAIVGEGEISFYELISNKPKSEIKGLIYRGENGSFQINERRIMKDIDLLPFPKFKNFELEKYTSKIKPVISSRGCPFKCIFCQQSSLLSKNWRGVSADYFIKQLKYWYDRGYKEFHILDDNFTYNPKRIEELVELYEKEEFTNINIYIIGGIRISSTNEKILKLLRRLGVDHIAYGVEAFYNPVLSFIKKGTTEKMIEDVIKLTTKMGFKVKLFLIIGFPYQTVESLRKTYRLVLTYPVYEARFFNLVPYEKTELMSWIDENGELIYPPSVYMNDFKNFQEIPLFKAKYTMTVEERTNELKIAQDVARIVKERRKYLFD